MFSETLQFYVYWSYVIWEFHCVEILRTIQSAENCREKFQFNQRFSARRKFETNLLKSRKFDFPARKNPEIEKAMINHFDCYSLL